MAEARRSRTLAVHDRARPQVEPGAQSQEGLVKPKRPRKGRFEPAAKHDTDTIPRRPENPRPRLTAFQYWLRFDWRHHGVLFGAVC
jgi:hypothetical protein